MKQTKYARYYSIEIGVLFSALFISMNSLASGSSTSSAGSVNIGFGASYNSGGANYVPAYGGGVFGYGSGYGSIGAIGGVCGGWGSGMPAPILMPPAPPAMPGYPSPCQVSCGGGGGGFYPGGGAMIPPPGIMGPGQFGPGQFGPGGMMPPFAAAPIAPPAPIVPPHLAMQNQGWGPGWGSYPGPVMPGPAWGSNCSPCGMGIPPVMPGPVMGGPVMDGGVYTTGRGGSSGSGIVMIGSQNEWEKNDTADILWSTAIGIGLQASNVYPVAIPRQQPSYVPPMWWGGDRETGLYPRPHVGP